MLNIYFVFLFFTLFCLNFSYGNVQYKEITKEDLALLPQRYELEDYNECFKNNQLFCKSYITLKPIDETKASKLWKIISELKKNPFYYAKDEIFSAICVNETKIERGPAKVTEMFNQRFAENGLKVVLDDIRCLKERYPRNIVENIEDVVVLSGILLYLWLIMYATYKTYQFENNKSKTPIGKYLSLFALQKIIRDIGKTTRNEDFQNLKSMQGLRTINIAGTILFHSYMFNQTVFVKNADYFEGYFRSPIRYLAVLYASYLVQIFFLFSAWLVAVQVKNMYNRNGTITFKDIILLAVNRYFRLIVPIALTVFLHRNTASRALVPDLYRDLILDEVDRCKQFGWKNFLFVQNILYPEQMCSPGTWYIATDTQLYFLSLILLFLKFRYNIKFRYSILCVLAYCSWVQGLKYINYDIDGIYRMRPHLVNPKKAMFTKEFLISYVHTYSNVQTYMVGLCFGVFYVDNKNKDLFNTWIKKCFYWIAFLGIPFLILIVTMDNYSRIFETIWGLTSKPLFSFGIGIGVLGMASKMGGLVKKICVFQPLVFLADFTYCVYIFHFIVIFLPKMLYNEMVEFNDSLVLKIHAQDLISSFLAGIAMYVLIEQPISQLQRLVIPQPRKKTTKQN